jgi:hypothetical protein
MRLFSFLLLLFYVSDVNAQIITQISTVWDDKIDEWTIYTDNEDVEGLLELRWPLKNDLSEWQYEVGEDSGIIKQTWKGNPNSWEIIPATGPRIIAKTVWKNDFTEWKIEYGNSIFRLKSKYRNIPFEWNIKKSREEEFLIYMYEEGDPRDWIIEDYIEDGNNNLAMAISFIAIYTSLPRN